MTTWFQALCLISFQGLGSRPVLQSIYSGQASEMILRNSGDMSPWLLFAQGMSSLCVAILIELDWQTVWCAYICFPFHFILCYILLRFNWLPTWMFLIRSHTGRVRLAPTRHTHLVCFTMPHLSNGSSANYLDVCNFANENEAKTEIWKKNKEGKW